MEIDKEYQKKIEDIKVQGEKYADKSMKEVYKEQKKALDDLQTLISKLYIEYAKDGYIVLSSWQRSEITTEFKEKLREMARKLAQNEVSQVESILRDIFKETYYQNAFIMESGMSGLLNFKLLKQEFIDEAVNTKFKGEMFSDRIWKNKADMIDKLQSSVIEAMKGKVYLDKVSRNIKDTFNVSAYESHRLVFTETARIQSKAQLQIGLDSGVKKVMWSATLDDKTNPKDAKLDGKVWDINDNHPIPPLHPNCRCVLINMPENWSPKKRRDNESKKIVDYADYEAWAREKGVDI